MALLCGPGIPIDRFFVIGANSLAFIIDPAEIILGSSQALFGGLGIPEDGFFFVHGNLLA